MKARIRWAVAHMLDRLPWPRLCWADLAVWALGWRRSPWVPAGQSCRADAVRCGSCYCGKLRRAEGGEGR